MSSLVNESTKLDVEVFGMAASNLHASAKPEAIDKYCPQQTSNSLSMPASLSESSQYVKSHHQDTHISHIAMDTIGQVAPRGKKLRVTVTFWEDEGILCYQVEARGICVARREDNHMINGTKLLNVAGMTRGRRDGILKCEKHRHLVRIGSQGCLDTV